MIKTGNKCAFGFSAVATGQKSATVNATPQLVVTSSLGKFTLTAPASKALGIAVGENVMFVNNIANVKNAIQLQTADVVEIAEKLGVDLNTIEGQNAVLKECTMWGIAKGIAEYNSKGEPAKIAIRLTEADKQRIIDEKGAEIVANHRAELDEKYGFADLSDEEVVARLTPDMITSPKVQSYTGSKTGTVGNGTGVGLTLNFACAAIWDHLKADLGEDATKKVRIFDVLTEEATVTKMSNGYEMVDVMFMPLAFNEDRDPIVRTSKEA